MKRAARERRPGLVRQRLRRGAYVLPSLFTTGNIMLGFFAIVRGYKGHFDDAALLIFAAGFLDALDGRIARLTHTESDFGREFDSLADVLTFGATPALLTYFWGLQDFGRLGWLTALYFLLCAAVRLARFNVQTKTVDSRSFVGLPSPLAAGAIASLLFLAVSARPLPVPREWLEVGMVAALIGVGSLMVSTFRYPSLKKVDLKQRLSYRAALALGSFILLLAYKPRLIFVAVLLYTLIGPAAWLWSRLRRRSSETAGEVAATTESERIEHPT